MKKLSDKEKLENYIRRKAEDKREREHLENSKDYEPLQEGFISDNK